jgi:hypothetical protein
MAKAVSAVARTFVNAAIRTTDTTARVKPKTRAARGETVCAGSGRRAVRRISWSMSRSR